MKRTVGAVLVAALIAAGCGKKEPEAPANVAATGSPSGAPAAVEDHSAEVKAAVEAGLAAEKSGGAAVEKWWSELLLPGYEAWFARVFGDENGKTLSAEYSIQKGRASLMRDLLHLINEKGATEVRVSRLTSPDDKEATSSAQKAAFKAMKEKVALYKAQFAKPGDPKAGDSLWSFVWVDGKVRWVASMRELK